MMAQVTKEQRFRKSSPCPVCSGWKEAPQGKGMRCWGFASSDGRFAHCVREEHANGLPLHGETYTHLLVGNCACGVQHGAEPAPSSTNGPGPTVTESRTVKARTPYLIKGLDGELVAKHIRIDYEDGEKAFFWERNGETGLGGMPVADVPLYGSEFLKLYALGSKVIVTEGAGPAKALRDRGFQAVGTVTGAHSCPSAVVLKSLTGFDICFWPDNDDDGAKHMTKMGAVLLQLGIPIKVIDWQDAPHKGDAVDFFKAGRTAEGVMELVEAAQPIDPEGVLDADTIEWEEPLSFNESSGPPFPTDVFPYQIAQFIEAQSKAMQAPTDLGGMLALGVAAASGAKRAKVFLNDEWSEPLNEFFLTVLPSGEKKSAGFKKIVVPLEERERELVEARRPEVEEKRVEREILEKQLQVAKDQAAKAKAEDASARKEDAFDLARQLAEFKMPNLPRLIADDATSEAVTSLLAEQGGRIAVMSTEGGLFETMAGRYSEGMANFDIYLKAYSGDAVRVDRKGRPVEHIADPALTLCLTVQPDVVRGLASKREFRGRGLISRLKFSIPKSMVGYRSNQAVPVPTALREAYYRSIQAILRLPDPREGEAHYLTLSPEAHALFQGHRDRIEVELRPGGQLSEMADWGNKLPGSIARSAGQLHLLEHAVDEGYPWDKPISQATMAAAIRLGDYFTSHALIAYAMMGADRSIDNARHIWEAVKRFTWETPHPAFHTGRFTLRDLWQQTRRHFQAVTELADVLEVLVQMGYLKEGGPANREGAGRRSSPEFIVNPLTQGKRTHNSHNSPEEALDVHSVNSVNDLQESPVGKRGGQTSEESPVSTVADEEETRI